jgi:hypothetical protein
MNKDVVDLVESLGGTVLFDGALIQFTDTTFMAALKKIYESGVLESRNNTIEEVAREIEKMTAFGTDTISSFAVYVRDMKDAKTKTS